MESRMTDGSTPTRSDWSRVVLSREVLTDQDVVEDPGPVRGRLDVPVHVHRPDGWRHVQRVQLALTVHNHEGHDKHRALKRHTF